MIHTSQLQEAAAMAAELEGITGSLANWPSAQDIIDSPYGCQVRIPANDGILVTTLPDSYIAGVADVVREKFIARQAELRLLLQDLGVQMGVN